MADSVINESKRKEAIAYLKKMIVKIQETRDDIVDKYVDAKDINDETMKELKSKLIKLGFKFEKVRMYFDNSMFPRDYSIKVIDIDSNISELPSSLSENEAEVPDGEHRNPCKIYKDLFTGYERCQ